MHARSSSKPKSLQKNACEHANQWSNLKKQRRIVQLWVCLSSLFPCRPICLARSCKIIGLAPSLLRPKSWHGVDMLRHPWCASLKQPKQNSWFEGPQSHMLQPESKSQGLLEDLLNYIGGEAMRPCASTMASQHSPRLTLGIISRHSQFFGGYAATQTSMLLPSSFWGFCDKLIVIETRMQGGSLKSCLAEFYDAHLALMGTNFRLEDELTGFWTSASKPKKSGILKGRTLIPPNSHKFPTSKKIRFIYGLMAVVWEVDKNVDPPPFARRARRCHVGQRDSPTFLRFPPRWRNVILRETPLTKHHECCNIILYE